MQRGTSTVRYVPGSYLPNPADLRVENVFTSVNARHEVGLSLLMPTRGNAETLKYLFAGLLSRSTCKKSLELVLYLDNDHIFDRQEFATSELNVTWITGPKLTMGAYNSVCFQHASGNNIMLMNDDVNIRTDGWDEKILKAVDRIGDSVFLIYPDDGIAHEKLCAFPVLSRKTCEILVHPFPDIYRRLFIDSHVMDIFFRLERLGLKRIVYLSDVLLEHQKDKRLTRQRIDHHDDHAFLMLADWRSKQANILKKWRTDGNVREGIVAIETKPIGGAVCGRLCKYFTIFLLDHGLPIDIRLRYLVRFSGHLLMTETALGRYLHRCKVALKTIFGVGRTSYETT